MEKTADHNGSCFPEASGLCHGIPRVQYGWPKIMQAEHKDIDSDTQSIKICIKFVILITLNYFCRRIK